MGIFDRYLLRRYWHVFGIAFCALFGLYFVIDVFTNVGDFLDFEEMLYYYGYRACYFFNVIGGTLEVIAAMVALALVQRHGELNPILSAGISTFRLMRPMVLGAVLVNAAIFLNQELVIPRIAMELQRNAGDRAEVTYYSEPVMDFETGILITAKKLNHVDQTIEEAEFTLSLKVSEKLTTISAKRARPIPAEGRRRGGWFLQESSQKYSALALTELGKKIILEGQTNEELTILTDVSFDRLYNKDKYYEYLSTWELMRRIRNPSFSHHSIRSQSLYLHTRLTKPLLNLIVVGVGVPFVVRKESVSLLRNLAVCGGVMGLMFAVNEVFQYLAKVNLLSPEIAVWAPILIWGSAAAWFTGLVRT